MNKEEFLSQLDKKLKIINEKERKDIVDEYRTHLEMKIKDGKSEEEATADFGNIDELVDEILDAYKINTEQIHNKEDKWDKALDNLFRKCKNGISSITSLDTDDVVKLLFEFFVVLLLLWLIRIPFEIVSSIGSSLLEDIIGLGVGILLANIWELIFDLVYVVVFVVLLIKVFDKRIRKYRNKEMNKESIIDDFKDSLSSNKKEEKENEYDFQSTQQTKEYSHVSKDILKIGRIIMRVFYVILMIPMIAVIAGLACALGVMVVISIEGVSLFSPFIIIAGLFCIAGAFMSLAYDVLWKRGKSL